ncbi:hypothetical protein RF11_08592 [Thelohanellus kitauei]|uniref:Uncharacterized protein n=1 Tax=Thelohanellus kitauei TaxID=669202 RepID=A0A0C2MV79_THEKT|nr:hypothetical protein RF11_08592 [Thelohanellus kitauei]
MPKTKKKQKKENNDECYSNSIFYITKNYCRFNFNNPFSIDNLHIKKSFGADNNKSCCTLLTKATTLEIPKFNFGDTSMITSEIATTESSSMDSAVDDITDVMDIIKIRHHIYMKNRCRIR